MDCNDDVRSIGSTRFHSLAILLLYSSKISPYIEVLLAPFVVEHSASIEPALVAVEITCRCALSSTLSGGYLKRLIY